MYSIITPDIIGVAVDTKRLQNLWAALAKTKTLAVQTARGQRPGC